LEKDQKDLIAKNAAIEKAAQEKAAKLALDKANEEKAKLLAK
jgi:hypothetical protein